MRVIPFEVRDAEIQNLVRLGVLAESARNDRTAIARAMGTMLDLIPFTWWQEALRLRGNR